jgi:hypothetical protein
LKKHKDGALIFYDSEFGTPGSYFDAFGIDQQRVLHSPITNIEQLKHDLYTQLDGIGRGEHVMILVDSLGNLASKKEVEDALEGKTVADMTRAKAFKSLFRIVTPHLTLKAIPMVVINHVYDEMSLFPRKIVGGGKGAYLSADNIWIIGREQVKEGKDVVGYQFNINIEKSRFVKEKSKFPVTVTHEGGIERYSGLFEMARELGFLVSSKQGVYQAVDIETGDTDVAEYRQSKIPDSFYENMISNPAFQDIIQKRYQIAYKDNLISYEPTEADLDEFVEVVEEPVEVTKKGKKK